MDRTLLFTVAERLDSTPITLHLSELSLEALGWTPGMNCWIRARTGAKKGTLWAIAADDDLLCYLVGSWAHDCNDFFIVTRPKGQPSPNTTPVPSAQSSPIQPRRSRKGQGSPLVDPNEAQPALRRIHTIQPKNTIEPFSQEEMDVSDENLLRLSDGKKVLAIDGEYLLGYIKSSIADGHALNSITVRAGTDEIVLTTDVWAHCLLRQNKFQEEFVSLFIEMCNNLRTFGDRLCKLHDNTKLFMKVKFFANDLLTSGSNEGAMSRLTADLSAPFYVSTTYFSKEEVDEVLNFPGGSGLTLKQIMEVQMSRKMESAREGRSANFDVCSSHDLAPVVCEIFGVRKGFQQEKLFRKAFKEFEKKWKKRIIT